MSEFKLQIVTPDGMLFDKNVQEIIVRTINGDVGIRARHAPYVTALGEGGVKIIMSDETRSARCWGGMLCVLPDMTRIISGGFQWEASA